MRTVQSAKRCTGHQARVAAQGCRGQVSSRNKGGARPLSSVASSALRGSAVRCEAAAGSRSHGNGRVLSVVVVAQDLNEVTVSDTKKKFLEAYPKPIPALYSTIVQELLVQHHLIKFGAKFEYDKVYALGFLSVYDGIMESFPGDNQGEILEAFCGALGTDLAQLRRDAEEVEQWASSCDGASSVSADASGSPLQQELSQYASSFESRKKVYNKFFGVGMFRVLELAKCTDPASLESFATSLNVPLTRVTSDLATYKGMLTKMTKAKELMQEIIEEQRKKSEQRAAEKAQASASNGELPNGGAAAST